MKIHHPLVQLSNQEHDDLPVVVFGIIRSDAKILLTERGETPRMGYFGFPGGHLKIGETLEEVLRREILEEIQCEISEFDSQAVVLVGPPNIDLEDDYYLAAKIAETAFGRHKILLRPLQSEIPDSEIAGNKIYYFIDCEIRGRPKKTIYTSRIYFCKPIEAIWMASNHDLKIQPVEGAFLRLLAEGRSFLRISK